MSKFIIKCPTCKSIVKWNEKSKFRPFCSKHCQLIDLSQWILEEEDTISFDKTNKFCD